MLGQLQGPGPGGGHYLLTADTIQGRAMVHLAPNSSILEGFWSEGGNSGMWRVYLTDPNPISRNNLTLVKSAGLTPQISTSSTSPSCS